MVYWVVRRPIVMMIRRIVRRRHHACWESSVRYSLMTAWGRGGSAWKNALKKWEISVRKRSIELIYRVDVI
jgi:hypothetical protein